MRRRALALAAVICAGVAEAKAQTRPATRQAEGVIDVRSVRTGGANSFEALWAAYRKADRAGDLEARGNVFREIRRVKTERNVRGLERIALALVARGHETLKQGERSAAAVYFEEAAALDPQLPDAHFGLARARAGAGVVGTIGAVANTLRGLLARLDTARGRHYLVMLSASALLLAVFATATVLGLVVLLRNGPLLLHDIEEMLGSGRRPIAMIVFAVLVALPVLALQGWAWLPLWWLALLCVYLSGAEMGVALAVVVAAVLAGPLLQLVETRVHAFRDPLFRAGLRTIEDGPDNLAVAALERARTNTPSDKDFSYLLASLYRKIGRLDDAASVYRELIRLDANDLVALNNLGNIDFSRQDFGAAIARYIQGRELASDGAVKATYYYNLSQAHLQKFEFQPAQEMRSLADRADERTVRAYDALWRYEGKNETAVVDLGVSAKELWAKFAGAGSQGSVAPNLALTGGGRVPGPNPVGALFNRFGGFAIVFVAVGLAMWLWRGKRAFTGLCLKCGTPFCRRCHLGAATGGLCTQCHHLFVVRDGVSGPARNQKLLEVQKEDQRRERIFRVLSLLSPGAGHVYARRPVAGVLLAGAWYLVLAVMALGGRILPFTESASALTVPWGIGLAVILLLILYTWANRARPDFEVAVSLRRPPSRGKA